MIGAWFAAFFLIDSVRAWFHPLLLNKVLGAWFVAFLFTEVVETPLYARALRPRPLHERVLLGAMASALTHPLVWWIVLVPFEEHRTAGIAVAEGFAVCAEALWLHLLGVRRAFGWALVVNATSVLAGETSRALFRWP